MLRSRPRLTLLGRATLLLALELLANAACWATAAALFTRDPATQPILSLALLAWTIGLRHALDADHISAIDNATRGLLSLGQTPVTCGLFFSLGHSSVVIAVNIAIAASTNVAGHLDGIGSVGGIIGASVSASFLFLVGLANSIILYRTLRRRRRRSRTGVGNDDDDAEPHAHTLTMKLIGPIVRFVDRPWKMYPVGLLFGLGFDTASSIALLAVSAIAKRDTRGRPIPPADIVILPLLFTAGMSLVDSLDSVLMLYSYAGFPRAGWKLLDVHTDSLDARAEGPVETIETAATLGGSPSADASANVGPDSDNKKSDADVAVAVEPARDSEPEPEPDGVRLKRHLMSNLSVVLTAMSIVVAFSISLITIMGLVGENCARCARAADAEDGGGLEGRWWRFWAAANDNSGYIGAGIVGSFVVVVGAWYGVRRIWLRSGRKDVSEEDV